MEVLGNTEEDATVVGRERRTVAAVVRQRKTVAAGRGDMDGQGDESGREEGGWRGQQVGNVSVREAMEGAKLEIPKLAAQSFLR
jgi:hypothetical protein